MNNQIAYIDEFGNNGLDFESVGVSTHFIVTAILIDSNNIKEVENKIEDIRKANFQTGEIKSSKVSDNDDRRLKILTQLNDIDYHIFSIVIDKRELETEGFRYKESFYKFLHSLVDRELFSVFPDLLIVADEHGGNKFKEGFIKYIKARHVPDLFTQSEFRFSNSKSDLIVQLADFVTGTLARCYESKKISPRRSEFLSCLKDKIIEVRSWPPDYKPYTFKPETLFKNYDPIIASLGLNLAQQYISQTERSKTPFEIDQITCLKYLLFYFNNINPENYISTFELIKQIEKVRNSPITMHYFRSRIVAKLRDNGVLIASSTHGYKLPSSKRDLYEFVNHSNSYIQPMIERLIKCRNKVKLATKNEVDILDEEEFKYLQLIIQKPD